MQEKNSTTLLSVWKLVIKNALPLLHNQ